MSANNISWFHCGRCGSLFQAAAGESEERLCTECGLNPALGLEILPPERPARPETIPVPLAENPEISGKGHKSTHKKRRRSYFMLKLIIGWSMLILAIIFGASYRWGDHSNKKTFVSKAQKNHDRSAEDIAFLNDTSPLASRAFSGFLAAGTPETRNQYVLSPITTASRMARFYDLNPLPNIPPETLSFSKSAILDLPSGRALETLWSSADGQQIDAVFVQQDNEWRLDWDHFARFSTYPWPLFLAGSGEAEGEFRLLARLRLAEERKNADALSIVLYAPRFGAPHETGFQSPEFLIQRDTRNGRLLDAAFKLEKAGNRVFNVDIPNPNPEDIIRVRVKVRRIEEPTGRRFEIDEVIACHWYSVDVPGVEIPEAPAENPPPADPESINEPPANR